MKIILLQTHFLINNMKSSLPCFQNGILLLPLQTGYKILWYLVTKLNTISTEGPMLSCRWYSLLRGRERGRSQNAGVHLFDEWDSVGYTFIPAG